MKRFHFLSLLLVFLFWLPLRAEAKVVIKLGHSQAPGSLRQQVCEKFAKEAAGLSGGEIEVRIFPSSQLGSTRDMIENLKTGALQVVVDSPCTLSGYSKLAEIFVMPYVIRSREHADAVWNSATGQELFEAIAGEAGILPIALQWQGARHIFSARRVSAPGDMKELKVRVSPYEPLQRAFELWGASPVALPYKEIYLALQKGIVEALENPIELAYTSGLSEVIKYITLTRHAQEFDGFLMGFGFLKSLSPAIREALIQAAKSAAKWGGDIVQKSEAASLEKFRKEGAEVIQVDEALFENSLKEWKSGYRPEMMRFIRKFDELNPSGPR